MRGPRTNNCLAYSNYSYSGIVPKERTLTDYPESERDGQSHKAALNRVPADDGKQRREEHNAVADQLQVQPKPPGKEQFLQVNMLRSMYKNSNIKLKEDKS